MAIFIDSGNLLEIEKYHRMGIIRGVTTNPSILLSEGVIGGLKGIKERMQQIAELIDPLPLSVEVTSNDKAEMLEQSERFSEWAKNINVKITIHGPKGELVNMEVIHELENQKNIRVNATAMMSAQQCLIAAMAGATWVSIFGGRVNDMGYNSVLEITKLRDLLDKFKLSSQIIVGSTRETFNITDWLVAGADIVTVQPKFIGGMIVHPYTKETVEMFLRDAASGESKIK